MTKPSTLTHLLAEAEKVTEDSTDRITLSLLPYQLGMRPDMDVFTRQLHAFTNGLERFKAATPYEGECNVDPALALRFSRELLRLTEQWAGGPNKLTETMAAYAITQRLRGAENTDAPGFRVIHMEAQNGCDLLVVPTDVLGPGPRYRHEIKTTCATGKTSVNFVIPRRVCTDAYETLAFPDTTGDPAAAPMTGDVFFAVLGTCGTLKKKATRDCALGALFQTTLLNPTGAPDATDVGALLGTCATVIDTWARTLALATPPLVGMEGPEVPDNELLPDPDVVANGDAGGDGKDDAFSAKLERGLALHGTRDGSIFVIMDTTASKDADGLVIMEILAPLLFAYLLLHYFLHRSPNINLGGPICKSCKRSHRLAALERLSPAFAAAYTSALEARKPPLHALDLLATIRLQPLAYWVALFDPHDCK